MSMFESNRCVARAGLRQSRCFDRQLAAGRSGRDPDAHGVLYDPISRLHQLNQLVQAGRRQANVFLKFSMKTPSPALQPRSVTPAPRPSTAATCTLIGDIRYEDVSFSYVDGLSALRHISFHALPGTTTALVGATGAGKSTLVNLLVRFYEFDSGQIYVDDRPVREYDLRALREAIGVVTQESFLFNGSIRENLLMGKPTAVTRNYGARWMRRTRDTSLSVCRRGLKAWLRARREIERWRETAALNCAGAGSRILRF